MGEEGCGAGRSVGRCLSIENATTNEGRNGRKEEIGCAQLYKYVVGRGRKRISIGAVVRSARRGRLVGADDRPEAIVEGHNGDPAVRLFRVRYAMRMRNAAAFQALRSRCFVHASASPDARERETN